MELHNLGVVIWEDSSSSFSSPMPPLHKIRESKENTESIQLGSNRAAGVAGDDNIKSNRLRDSISGFSIGVYFISLSPDGVIPRGSRGFESELLSSR